MTRATSIYLDLLRCIAAFGVFFGHASFRWFAGEHNRFPRLGHEMVIVFFFLSGYVIADATLGKRRSAVAYVAARLSRLYSVVGPAVILTAGLCWIGTWMAPAFYAGFLRPHEHIREVMTALFAQELWFFSASPASNEPLWSLGYEFWYYAIFGCWVFAATPRVRWVITGVLLAIAGPKILLLFPIWLLGVYCWKIRRRSWVSPLLARLGFVVTAAAAVLLIASRWAAPTALAIRPWFYSGRFISDWVLGLAVAANVACFDRGFGTLTIRESLERPIRAVANSTFSLYAYHFAILVFLAAMIPYDRSSGGQVASIVGIAFVAIFLLQRITEAQRPRLRRLIERWLNRWVGGRVLAVALESPVCSDLRR